MMVAKNAKHYLWGEYKFCISLCLSLLLVWVTACNSSKKSGEGQEQVQQLDAPDTPAEAEEGLWTETCPEVLTLAFYNVENLFDTIDDPEILDEEFLPQGKKKWGAQRYQAKLDSLAKVIALIGKDQYDADGVDLIGFAEVENSSVLEDLFQHPKLKDKGFRIVHRNSPDKRGIDVALVFREGLFETQEVNSKNIDFSDIDVKEFRQTLTRDVLVVSGKLCQQDFSFLVNHWPSRRGGQAFSAPKRKYVARQVRTIVDSIKQDNPNERLILMGDFNDTPFDPSIQSVLGADTNPQSALYNTVAYLQAQEIGSHYWKEERNMLDQMMVSQNLRQPAIGGAYAYLTKSAKLFKPAWILQGPEAGPYEGFPFRTYVGKEYLGGFSDHLPVYFHLIKSK